MVVVRGAEGDDGGASEAARRGAVRRRHEEDDDNVSNQHQFSYVTSNTSGGAPRALRGSPRRAGWVVGVSLPPAALPGATWKLRPPPSPPGAGPSSRDERRRPKEARPSIRRLGVVCRARGEDCRKLLFNQF